MKQQTSQRILYTSEDFFSHELPNEIFAETESFQHGNIATNQSDSVEHGNTAFNDFCRQLCVEDYALIDSVLADLGDDFDHSDVLRYIDPDFDISLNHDMDSMVNKIHANLVQQESLKNTSVVTAPVEEQPENNIWETVGEPVQKLREELSHLRQVNFQLEEELNRYKIRQEKPQQSLEVLQMEQQKQPQVSVS